MSTGDVGTFGIIGVEADEDTLEGHILAREDASRQMAEEGLGDGTVEEAGLVVEKAYVGSYLVSHADGRFFHGVCKTSAVSHAEAIGLSYMDVERDYPTEEGWSAPSIIVDPMAILIMPGLPGPVMLSGSGLDYEDGAEDDGEEIDHV